MNTKTYDTDAAKREQALRIYQQRERLASQVVAGWAMDYAAGDVKFKVIDLGVEQDGDGVAFTWVVDTDEMRKGFYFKTLIENVESTFSPITKMEKGYYEENLLSWGSNHEHHDGVCAKNIFVELSEKFNRFVFDDVSDWLQDTSNSVVKKFTPRDKVEQTCDFTSIPLDLKWTTSTEYEEAVVPAMNRHVMALTHFDEESAEAALRNCWLTEETHEHVRAHSGK